MERHCANAIAVANYLKEHPKVAWVNFAGLPESPYYDLSMKYTNGQPSALLTFGIKGGFDAGVKFYDALQMFLRLVNIGDVKSLAAHPASTTHRQLSEEELQSAGVTPDMIRLCIGIEDIEDIIADLDQALHAACVFRLEPSPAPARDGPVGRLQAQNNFITSTDSIRPFRTTGPTTKKLWPLSSMPRCGNFSSCPVPSTTAEPGHKRWKFSVPYGCRLKQCPCTWFSAARRWVAGLRASCSC